MFKFKSDGKLNLVQALKTALGKDSFPKTQVPLNDISSNLKVKESGSKTTDNTVYQEPKTTKPKLQIPKRKPQPNLAEAQLRTQLNREKEKQRQTKITKRAKLYFLGALEVSNNDLDTAKMVLSIKKRYLVSEATKSVDETLAVDMAMEQLDKQIASQHGEVVVYENQRKR